VNRADHVVELHENSSPDNSEEKGTPEGANKSFNGLLRRKLDQRCPSEKLAPDVSKGVIANDEGRGDPEPDQPFQDVVDNKVAASGGSVVRICGKIRHQYLENTMIKRLMCTQQNRPNCCLRYPFLSDITNPMKPMI
jgi:hypothetical protein